MDKVIELKVVPNSSKTEMKDGKLYLKAAPEKGKANLEIIKFFKKQKLDAEIISGKTSRKKLIRLKDC